MTQTAGSVSSCSGGFGNKEVAGLEKELTMVFIYTTLLLSLPFLFFSNFQAPGFFFSLVISHLALTLKPSSHLLTDTSSECLLSTSTNRQQCKSACPERELSSPGWSQVLGVFSAGKHHFSGGLGSMWCYLVPCTSCQLSHHALCSQVQLIALSACGNMLSSSGFMTLVVTSRSWLPPELLDMFWEQ